MTEVSQQSIATIPGIEYLVQAGFAGLFVWLLFDTRKEASAREKKSEEREAAYQKTIADFSRLLSEQGKAMSDLSRLLSEQGKTLEAVQKELSAMSKLLEKVMIRHPDDK